MTTCSECEKMYSYKSHYGICANTFGKCVDCMIKAKELNESHLDQIYFLAGDIEPDKTVN